MREREDIGQERRRLEREGEKEEGEKERKGRERAGGREKRRETERERTTVHIQPSSYNLIRTAPGSGCR